MSVQGINSSIPFPAAARQAYAGARTITPPAVATESDAVKGRERIDQLVVGQVSSPINRGEGFEEAASSGPRVQAPSLPLYTNAPDRVEAATQIALGAQIDLDA